MFVIKIEDGLMPRPVYWMRRRLVDDVRAATKFPEKPERLIESLKSDRQWKHLVNKMTIMEIKK